MAESVVSPNTVYFSGENPFLRLKASASGPDTTVCALWRAHHCVAGPGHALFVKSEVTDGKVLVLTDNEALLRWVQKIEALLRPDFGNEALPFTKASFSRAGDTLTTYRELASAKDLAVELSWSGLGGGYLISLEPGNDIAGDWGVASFMLPARQGELTVNGKKAAGGAFPELMAGKASSTAALAFAENWYRAN